MNVVTLILLVQYYSSFCCVIAAFSTTLATKKLTSSNYNSISNINNKLAFNFPVARSKDYDVVVKNKTILKMTTLSNDQLENLSPRKLVQLGMIYFKQGDVENSIELFDRAERMDKSLTPYLWQRGISYYYLDRFQDGSVQFRNDVAVNPLDVEEIVWDIACQYMANKNDEMLINKMSLPKGKTDRRKIMVSYSSTPRVWFFPHHSSCQQCTDFVTCIIHLLCFIRELFILFFVVMVPQSKILFKQVMVAGENNRDDIIILYIHF